MKSSEIIKSLRMEIEPLPDKIYGNRYRAAAYLTDGTYLPCVVFQSKRRQVNWALRRFEELKEEPRQYRMVVESFVAGSSCIADYHILRIDASPFAWPLGILQRIHGETSMGWTAFVVEMNDGKRFHYGTTFSVEFFDLPDGYGFKDIKEIHSGRVHATTECFPTTECFREKPFFTCYVAGIDG